MKTLNEIKTDDLNKQLETLSAHEFSDYLKALSEAPTLQKFFELYMEHNNIGKSDIFRRSGLSKSYVYEILNGTKTAPSRDHIIAMCLGAHMDLNTTQHALRIGKVGELYSKVPRDAAVILHINQKKYDIGKLNSFLEENKLDTLQVQRRNL